MGFSKSDIDEMCFIELIEFAEQSLRIKYEKEQKEIMDNIRLIQIIHSDNDGLQNLLKDLEKYLHIDKHHDFNPSAGALG